MNFYSVQSTVETSITLRYKSKGFLILLYPLLSKNTMFTVSIFFENNAKMPRGNRSGIPHAKNQPPRPKNVASKAMEFLAMNYRNLA